MHATGMIGVPESLQLSITPEGPAGVASMIWSLGSG